MVSHVSIKVESLNTHSDWLPLARFMIIYTVKSTVLIG